MRHFTFSPSAAGCMRQALTILGRRERVFPLNDDLSYGPIDPPPPSLRAAWATTVLGLEEWLGDLITESDSFWQAATSGEADKVIWLCRGSAAEYCGFLELVTRLGEEPYFIVDATNEQFTGVQGKTYSRLSLGELAPEAFVQNRLFDKQKPLTQAERDDYIATWARLRIENAPFRIVTERGLVSAPIDHFDAALMSHITPKWQKMARVVALALATDFRNENIVAFRLRALARIGRIEMRGSGNNMRASEVRLPSELTSAA